MTRWRGLTPRERRQRDKRIFYSYLRGSTLEEAGRAHGLTGSAVYYILKAMGVKRRPVGRPKGIPRPAWEQRLIHREYNRRWLQKQEPHYYKLKARRHHAAYALIKELGLLHRVEEIVNAQTRYSEPARPAVSLNQGCSR